MADQSTAILAHADMHSHVRPLPHSPPPAPHHHRLCRDAIDRIVASALSQAQLQSFSLDPCLHTVALMICPGPPCSSRHPCRDAIDRVIASALSQAQLQPAALDTCLHTLALIALPHSSLHNISAGMPLTALWHQRYPKPSCSLPHWTPSPSQSAQASACASMSAYAKHTR